MKKIISILLSITFCLSLVACGSNGGSSSSSSKKDNNKYVGAYLANEDSDPNNKWEARTELLILLTDGTFRRGLYSESGLSNANSSSDWWVKDTVDKANWCFRGEGGKGSWWVVDDDTIGVSYSDNNKLKIEKEGTLYGFGTFWKKNKKLTEILSPYIK